MVNSSCRTPAAHMKGHGAHAGSMKLQACPYVWAQQRESSMEICELAQDQEGSRKEGSLYSEAPPYMGQVDFVWKSGQEVIQFRDVLPPGIESTTEDP